QVAPACRGASRRRCDRRRTGLRRASACPLRAGPWRSPSADSPPEVGNRPAVAIRSELSRAQRLGGCILSGHAGHRRWSEWLGVARAAVREAARRGAFWALRIAAEPAPLAEDHAWVCGWARSHRTSAPAEVPLVARRLRRLKLMLSLSHSSSDTIGT